MKYAYFFSTILFSLSLSFNSLFGNTNLSEIEGYSTHIKPFFKKYCIDCHGPKKDKGDFRVDKLISAITHENHAESWQDVLDILNLDEMPPEDEKQPTLNELSNVIESITSGLFEAKKKLVDSSFITMAKLNKREYQNTIKDLLGVSTPVEELTEDGTLEGFDTIGTAQSISDIDFDLYLELGEKALDLAFKKNHTVESSIRTLELEDITNKNVQSQLKKLKINLQKVNQELKQKPLNKDLQLKKERTESLLLETNKYVTLTDSKTGHLLGLQQKSSFSNSVYYLLDSHTETTHSNKRRAKNLKTTPPGKYIATFTVGLQSHDLVEEPIFVETRLENKSKGFDSYSHLIGTHKVTGLSNQPQEIKVSFDYKGHNQELLSLKVSQLSKNIYDLRNKKLRNKYKARPYIWIDSITLEGPINKPSIFEKKFLAKGLNFDSLNTSSNVRHLFKEFAFEACRHKAPSDQFITSLMKHYDTLKADSLKTEDAIKKCLAIILATPNFIFKHEISSLKANQHRRIDDLELANRLSYFLWSSPPDETLYELAHTNKLHEPPVLQEQIDRLLKHEKSANFTRTFVSQWLGLEDLDMIVANASKFPKFNETLRENFKEETFAFFEELIRSNLDVSQLIDSDFLVLNNALADYYQIKTEPLQGFQTLAAPSNKKRGGLISQASILTMTSTGERTSPVLRGVFIYDKILGYPVPPPPPNVPQLDQDGHKNLTVRKTLDLHKSKAQCASCHSRIDPLGFALENFDAIGTWRDQEKVSKSTGKGMTLIEVDSTGKMPGSQSEFKSIEDFKANLLKEKDRLALSVGKSMLTYALGRRVGFSDGLFLDEFLKEWKSKKYKMRDLVTMIVTSEKFNQK